MLRRLEKGFAFVRMPNEDAAKVLEAAGGAALSALQMHGTGTGLGDPIEVGAALEALLYGSGGEGAAAPLHLLGSKSTVGHAEPAAGISALAYAVQQVRHRSDSLMDE